ncbi:MAG TPA: cytochrome c biogenesis protein CcdA [Candidatus Bilamarchaeum sp.]|nr:cytochrome c biogenesis protein CcdA [Candidatus Bilamarchaeum sp.]
MAGVTIVLAFIAGLISFLSPCVLPLIPAYLTFLAGTTLKEKYTIEARTRIFLSSVSFVLGFSVVFSVLGVLLQSVLSAVAYSVQAILGYIGGIVIMLFGLMLIGVIRIPALESERKIHLAGLNASYVTSFAFGAAFAVGWTPCVGAVLGGILTLAVTDPGSAFPLMLSYSLGLGIPFLFVGLFVSQASGLIRKIGPLLKWLNVVFGIILVALGILVFTGTLPLVANFGPLNDLLLQ